MSAAIPREAAQALLNRAITGLLFSASMNAPLRAEFWRGSVKALRDLMTGDGAECLARKDFLSGSYEPPACLEAAWAALPVDVECLSFAEVQKLLAAHGVEITTDPVAKREFDAAANFSNSEIPAIDLDDEHAPEGVDVRDDAIHGGAMVAQGGAA